MKTKLLSYLTVLIGVLVNGDWRGFAQTPLQNMVWINQGNFTLGSPDNEIDRFENEGPQTEVTLTQGFYIGKYEVTQREYLSLMNTNPSYFNGVRNGIDYGTDLKRPVEMVSWRDAINFCGALTLREQSAGRIPEGWQYRLPTESEWEYACRAGTTTRFSFGDDLLYTQLREYAWYWSDSAQLTNTHPVGLKRPNLWGLHDMHGNVWEWTLSCIEDLNEYPGGSLVDPMPDIWNCFDGVYRGGSWAFSGDWLRSATRHSFGSEKDVGFRVVLSPTKPQWRQLIETQTLEPTYSECPVKQPGKDSLIVVTHGWNPNPTWVTNMTNAITRYLANNSKDNWQVHAHYWVEKAMMSALSLGFERALYRGEGEGQHLGVFLGADRWVHIHFIAHSAGSALIEAATHIVKEIAPGTAIHETFLDPYVGVAYKGRQRYGHFADWSDNYFSRDNETFPSFDLTQGPLDNCYNVDVTWLDPSHREEIVVHTSTQHGEVSQKCYQTLTSSHAWPHEFYTQSIPDGIGGFGFALSKETGNWNGLRAQYPPGVSHPPLGSGISCNIPDSTLTVSARPKKVELTNADILRGIFESETGVIVHGIDDIALQTGSPVWIALVISLTNAYNTLSFTAEFTSTNTEGLLTVYWGTNVLGTIDERVTSGLREYSFPLPAVASGSSHVLGFRLDAYTNAVSSAYITNIVLDFVGIPEPFKLAFTGVITNSFPVQELSGPAGYNYRVETSSNLTDWSTVAILVNTNGTVRFTDTTATNAPVRFYRAVSP